MLYLLIGQDSPSKDAKLQSIKEKFLKPATRDFNLDVFYARDLDLSGLQERILALPLNARERMIIIKEAEFLQGALKDFLLKIAPEFPDALVLVLEMNGSNPKDNFAAVISKYAQVTRFKEAVKVDTFALSRQIEIRNLPIALGILSQLLKNGEKPERILGGLRYTLERNALAPDVKKRLKSLMICDIDIKTGKLRPDFALEKLVIKLCSFSKLGR